MSRAEQLARYRALVSVELPERARAERWVVTSDHCFGRILLDHAVGGCWYDALERGRVPARDQLSDEQLAGAVERGERMLREGAAYVRQLDAQSLAWRGKPPKRS